MVREKTVHGGNFVTKYVPKAFFTDTHSSMSNSPTISPQPNPTTGLTPQELKIHRFRCVGALSSGYAHEYNNLLTAVIGSVSVARMDIRPNSPLNEHLDAIEQATARMANLCRQLLEMGGATGAGSTALSLNPLVIEIVKHLRHSAIPARVQIKTELTPNPPIVTIAPSNLRLILSTLLLEAVPRLPEAGAMCSISSRIQNMAGAGDCWLLDVIDNGQSGFSPQETHRALEVFVASLKAALVYRELPQGGNHWQLQLPVVLASESASHVVAPGRATPAKTGAIMVVDDDESLRTLALYVVERAGYIAVGARDGYDAVEKFRADPGAYRLILLDVSMPRLSGEETLAMLRTIRREVPVLLITGHEEESLRSGEKEGVLGVLHKPFSPDELKAALKKHAV